MLDRLHINKAIKNFKNTLTKKFNGNWAFFLVFHSISVSLSFAVISIFFLSPQNITYLFNKLTYLNFH